MSDSNSRDLQRRTVLGGLAGLAGLSVTGATAASRGLPDGEGGPGFGLTVEATQEEGRPVNWVLPGPRRLSEEVFGTPDDPLRADAAIERARRRRPEMADLLEEFPFPVGVPEALRDTTDDGSAYTTTTVPTPFGDDFRPVEGSVDVVYRDRSPWAGYRQGRDQVDLDVEFTDPAGNTYTVDVAMLDRERTNYAGGVLVGGLIHGTIGIGSPLFPKAYNYGSFWGIGTVDVNDGEQTLENRFVHFMTTQMVRDSNYNLALDENLPLADPFIGGSHHTHGIVFPVEMTPDGPRFEPLGVPFPPDSDRGQPFVHIMYDMDDVTVTAGADGSAGGGGG